jgi:Zn-finger nucleic acid-binding protein
MTEHPPAYGTPPAAPGSPPSALTCPKCRGAMRTYERNGLHIEQCETCRGIFLDFGELESLLRLESQLAAPPPQQHAQHYPQQPYQPEPHYNGPGWGQHGGHRYRKGGLSRMFFSS